MTSSAASAAARTLAAPAPRAERPLRILFVASAHNSLSQRAFVALTELGHDISVEVVDSSAAIEAAVARHTPELIVCPMLKSIIPEPVWRNHRCLIVHPGPRGDRGPSSLDWAIELEMAEWGVTVLEATGEVDGGGVWASRTFRMRDAGKSSLYRHEVRRAAIEAVVDAVTMVAAGGRTAEPVDYDDPTVTGRARPLIRQPDRAIDWSSDSTANVIRRIRAAEGHPGVLDRIGEVEFHLFGVHREATLRGAPGEIIAQRHGAICRATVDGAVWISHLKRPGHFKLPATLALAIAGYRLDVPEPTAPLHAPPFSAQTFREIAYEEHRGVGYLHFDFYNGAMSTDQCRRLLDAYRFARSRETRVIVLMGGPDFFSNGIHLNVIEAADDPAAESWSNLQAIDDVVRDVIETDSQLVVSALTGDAAAGGVPFALAADYVVAREDVVLNPYYRHMGGLYGSEYWTYLLPRRVGDELTATLTSAPFEPLGARRAVDIGLIDDAFGDSAEEFHVGVRRYAEQLASSPARVAELAEKRRSRARDEQRKPLAAYRAEELSQSRECFFGPDPSYHEARRRFVYKLASPDAVAPAPR
jgi:putative two-component system protein, hydrogenase maturation factor HypX/HoxX